MAGTPLSITFSCNTDAHSTGDVIAAPEELVGWSRAQGRGVLLRSVVLLDKSDTGVALDLVFLNASGSIGAESAAFAPVDAVAATIIGTVNVPTTYYDAVDSKYQIVKGLDLIMHPTIDSTSIWVALVARGSITPGASDIVVHFGREFL